MCDEPLLSVSDLSRLKTESIQKAAQALRKAIEDGTLLKLVDGNWVDVDGNIVRKNEKVVDSSNRC